MRFYLQSGYEGRETGVVSLSLPKEACYYSNQPYRGGVPVGTVEFCEEIYGVKKTDYYPSFLSSFFNRKVWEADALPEGFSFVKPADKHKRFDAECLSSKDVNYLSLHDQRSIGPYWCSEIISFDNEWRYYVANGKILAAHWYQGPEECEAPELDFVFPEDFCGAVDFGIYDGKMTLVENNLPYACGWYGPFGDGEVYAEWLEYGYEYVRKS